MSDFSCRLTLCCFDWSTILSHRIDDDIEDGIRVWELVLFSVLFLFLWNIDCLYLWWHGHYQCSFQARMCWPRLKRVLGKLSHFWWTTISFVYRRVLADVLLFWFICSFLIREGTCVLSFLKYIALIVNFLLHLLWVHHSSFSCDISGGDIALLIEWRVYKGTNLELWEHKIPYEVGLCFLLALSSSL